MYSLPGSAGRMSFSTLVSSPFFTGDTKGLFLRGQCAYPRLKFSSWGPTCDNRGPALPSQESGPATGPASGDRRGGGLEPRWQKASQPYNRRSNWSSQDQGSEGHSSERRPYSRGGGSQRYQRPLETGHQRFERFSNQSQDQGGEGPSSERSPYGRGGGNQRYHRPLETGHQRFERSNSQSQDQGREGPSSERRPFGRGGGNQRYLRPLETGHQRFERSNQVGRGGHRASPPDRGGYENRQLVNRLPQRGGTGRRHPSFGDDEDVDEEEVDEEYDDNADVVDVLSPTKTPRERTQFKAELVLSREELRRLRALGLAIPRWVRIGKAGVTEGIVEAVHEVWRNKEVARIKVREGPLVSNMKRCHEHLEELTGGLVVFRAGTSIILYRGAEYKGPPPKKDPWAPEEEEEEDEEEEEEEVAWDGKSALDARPLLAAPSTDLWKRRIARIAGDGRPTKRVVEPPVRWLPPGQTAKLTNFEMMMLRRKGRKIRPAFVLGQQKYLDGLGAAILEYWEKNEIVKISARAVQNANLVKISSKLKEMIGGVLLAKEGGIISLYRGKDFLPVRIGQALLQHEERKRLEARVRLVALDEQRTQRLKDLGLDTGLEGEDGGHKGGVDEEGSDGAEVSAEARRNAGWEATEEDDEEEDEIDDDVSGSESDWDEFDVGEEEVEALMRGASARASMLEEDDEAGQDEWAEDAFADEQEEEVEEEDEGWEGGEEDDDEDYEGYNDKEEVGEEEEEGEEETEAERGNEVWLEDQEEEAEEGRRWAEEWRRRQAPEGDTSAEAWAQPSQHAVEASAPSVAPRDPSAFTPPRDDVPASGETGTMLEVSDEAIGEASTRSDAAGTSGMAGISGAELKEKAADLEAIPAVAPEDLISAVPQYLRRHVETITEEERLALRRRGLKEKGYLQLGRRGVFAGTIQNIHLHYKRHQTCKIKCKGVRLDVLPVIAEQLAVESGSILVDYIGTTVILYRGKNYQRPAEIIPRHMLNKQEALRRTVAEKKAEAQLQAEVQRSEAAEAYWRDRMSAAQAAAATAQKAAAGALAGEEEAAVEESLPKAADWLPPGVHEFAVIPEALDLNDILEQELKGEIVMPIKSPQTMLDLPAFWRAPPLTHEQRNRLAKQSKQSKGSAFMLGKKGFTDGQGKSLRQYFYRHAFAKVSLKQRPRGLTVKACIHELERLTGGVCVVQEPTRVIIYRGWPPNEPPPWELRKPAEYAVALEKGVVVEKSPAKLHPEDKAGMDILMSLKRSVESRGEEGRVELGADKDVSEPAGQGATTSVVAAPL